MTLDKFVKDSFKLLKGSKGQQYLEERELLNIVPLGFCTKKLLEKYKNNRLLKHKLVLNRREDSYILEDRIIFPIYDEFNNCIAISGRTLENKTPKYYNTRYLKSHFLYGLNYSKNLILQQNFCVIVEGYADFLRLYKYNIPVVAICGTSLSEVQFIKLIRYTKNLFICLDSDDPGQIAAEKNIEKFREYDVSIQNLRLGKNIDPDSFILQNGINFFKNIPALYT